MAFLSGASQDFYAQRLKRSASIERERGYQRTRTRSTSSSLASQSAGATPPVPSSRTGSTSHSRNPSGPSSPRRQPSPVAEHPRADSLSSPSVSELQHANRPSTSAGISAYLSAPETSLSPVHAPVGSTSRRVHHTPSASDLRDVGRPKQHKIHDLGLPKLSTSLETPSSLSSAARPHTSSSLSDSGGQPQSPPDYTSSSSAGRSRLFARPDSRMHPPISPSRYGGNLSDGNTSSDRGSSPLPSHRLDVKRLLSKPAAPSRTSVYSITSDSDAAASPGSWRSNPYALSPSQPISTAPWLGFNKEARLAAAADHHRLHAPSRASSADGHLARPSTSPMTSPLSSTPPSPSPQARESREPPREKEEKKEKLKEERSPRVLRKRAPGSQSVRASAVPSPTTTKGSSPSTSSSATRRPGDSRPVSHLSLRSPRGGETPEPRRMLTPAAALAQAYKQQETHREGLAKAAQGEASPPPSPPPSSRLLQGHPRRGASESAASKTASSPEPYYTVFGSGIGSPFDVSLRPGSAVSTVTASAPPDGTRRSLVRKVSGRFTRHKSSPSLATVAANELPTIKSVKSRSSESPSHDRQRQSLQERRSTSLPKDRRKSLHLSLDDSLVHVDDNEARPTDGSGSKRADGSVSPGATGTRLWKLVKRLSSNQLKDRYQFAGPSALPSPPPPVPAIPKDLLQTPTRPSSSSATVTPESGRPSPRVSTSAMNTPESSARGRRPSAGVQRASPASATAASKRSATTRSSSPHSGSSIADTDIPPIPRKGSTSLGQRILSPSALRLIGQDEDPQEISVLVGEPESFEPGGLSPPPRRTRMQSDSPEMPTFSIAASVNNFSSRKALSASNSPAEREGASLARARSLLPETALSPPPRPARSPHRPSRVSPVSDNPPRLPPLSLSAMPSPESGFTSLPPSIPTELGEMSRARPLSESGYSTRTTSTARPEASITRPRTPSNGASSGLKFREMNKAAPRVAMSDQEKDALWDDLLERSAKAGGTLHYGAEGAALLSDNVRFSTVSAGSAATTQYL
ncbi:hypothetical protein PENSPDRAFT_200207 [Peniophora sp. CONT]|nr:hypothetical protein PENSPDRAFT_200207 [Peniophora sp. CONT]